MAWNGSWASLGPSLGAQLHDLWWPGSLYPLLQPAAVCDSKGGAEGLQLSFSQHIMSSLFYHLLGRRLRLILPEVRGSPSRRIFGYFKWRPLFLWLLTPASLALSPSLVDLMVRSELETQRILPPTSPLWPLACPTKSPTRVQRLSLRQIKLWARISVWLLLLSLMLKSVGPKEISKVPNGRVMANVNNHNS